MRKSTRLAALAALFAGWSGAQSVPGRIVVIGIDGLSVDGVSRAATPHLHRLMESGSWTLEARGVMPTLSSPNWASMIGGAGPEQHGVTSNGHLRKMIEFRPVCASSDGKFPTIFGVLRSQRPSEGIAVFHDWGGLAALIEKDVPDAIRHERGAGRVSEAAARYWAASRPALLFVHLDNVDHAGHLHGWGSAPYLRAVEEADRLVGSLLSTVASAAGAEDTYVLITSDHGGTRRGHGRNSLAEIQIPWILTGPGIARGRLETPVNTFDTAATLAWILGLTPPECWIGRPVRAAFTPSLRAALDRSREPAAAGCAPERPVSGVLAAVPAVEIQAQRRE